MIVMIKYILMASGIAVLSGCSALTPTEQNLKVCQSEEDKISGCIAKTMLDEGEYYEVSYKNGVKEGGCNILLCKRETQG